MDRAASMTANMANGNGTVLGAANELLRSGHHNGAVRHQGITAPSPVMLACQTDRVACGRADEAGLRAQLPIAFIMYTLCNSGHTLGQRGEGQTMAAEASASVLADGGVERALCHGRGLARRTIAARAMALTPLAPSRVVSATTSTVDVSMLRAVSETDSTCASGGGRGLLFLGGA